MAEIDHAAPEALSDEERLARRAQIAALQAHMLAGEEHIDLEMRHYFASGVYVREMKIPAGVLAVGKIHKTEHILILLQGKLTVTTEEGSQTIEAPMTIVAKPGTKRVAYAHTDSLLQNIHAVGEERDLEKIEARFIAQDFDEINAASEPELITEAA
jgi:hypothetical protein